MKNLKNFGVSLNRNHMKIIIGGGYLLDLTGIGGSQCSNSGCENKNSGDNCVINGRNGSCSMGSCAGTQQLLCYA